MKAKSIMACFALLCAFYGDRIGIILTEEMETEGGVEWVFLYSNKGFERANVEDLTITSMVACSDAIDRGDFSRTQIDKLHDWLELPGYKRDPLLLSK